MKLLFRILLPLIVLGGGAAAIKWLMANRPVQKKRPSFTSVPVIEAIPLSRTDVKISVHTQGVIRPRLRTTLVSQVGGRIIEVSPNLRDGAFFKKDDILIRIEAADYEVAVATAKANLTKARLTVEELRLMEQRADSDVAVAQAEVAKAQVVVDEETARAAQASRDWKRLNPNAPAPDLVLRKPQLASANASLIAAKAKLAQTQIDTLLTIARTKTAEATVAINQTTLDRQQLDLARTDVRAPYNGRILTQEVDLGRFVSPGTVLAAIYPNEEIEIRLPCSSEDLAWLEVPGAPVILTSQQAGKSHTWRATITRSEGAFDSKTRQLSLVAKLEGLATGPDQRPPLHMGQFLTAEIAGTTLDNHFEIPRSAIRSGNEILLVDAQGMLSRHTITPVFSDRSRVVIDGNLPENTRLCTTPIAFATPNTKVHVKGDPKPTKDKQGKQGGPTGKKRGTGAEQGGPTP